MKFLKLSLLLSVYIILWGVNSFCFASPEPQNYTPNAQDITTHIIPLVRINGDLVRPQMTRDSFDFLIN
jgi:hypothetical protein